MNIHPAFLAFGVSVSEFDPDDTQPIDPITAMGYVDVTHYEFDPDATAPAAPVTADDTAQFMAEECRMPRWYDPIVRLVQAVRR